MITFNADEIFQIAEQIERNGAKFYAKAAEAAPDETHRELLKQLAQMEVEHEKVFKTMQADLTERDKIPTTFDPDDESALYLQASADGKIFDYDVDQSQRLTGSEPIEDILRTAIDLEKDSVIFYVSMKKMVAPQSADKIDAIIEEEMRHIVMLSDQLATV